MSNAIFTPDGKAAMNLFGSGGPFPNFSTSCEYTKSDDGTITGLKTTINISGKILFSGSSDRTGSALSSAFTIFEHFSADKVGGGKKADDQDTGTLEITSADGSSTDTYPNSTLMSAEASALDDSAHMFYREISYTFESNITASDDDEEILESQSEEWSIEENQEKTFEDGDPEGTIRSSYTISQNLSASGKKDTQGSTSPWAQAKAWCLARVCTGSPTDWTASKSANDKALDSSFVVKTAGGVGGAAGIDLSEFKKYTVNRTYSSNISEGSFSLNTSWVVRYGEGTTDDAQVDSLDVSIETSVEGSTSVTVNGSITGIDTSGDASTTNNKMVNARNQLPVIEGKAYALASALYATHKPSYAPSGGLKTDVLSKSIGENQAEGAITFSYSYNDEEVDNPDALSQKISITDDNKDRDVKVLAIIAIIGKADGPIIQDIGTTPERKKSASLEWVMKQGKRTTQPDGKDVLTAYAPAGTSYIVSKNETWSEDDGAYNLSIDWVY